MTQTLRGQFKALFNRYRVVVALLLVFGGVALRLSAGHLVGGQLAREILHDFGTFMALVVSLHLVYDFALRAHEHTILVEEMRRQLSPIIRSAQEQSSGNVASLRESLLRELSAFNDASANGIASLSESLRRELNVVKDAVERLTVVTDYLRVGDHHAGLLVTEALIYQRALSEIRAAQNSVDIFTSYLLEVDHVSPEAGQPRAAYFEALLKLAVERPPGFRYRRLVQAPLEVPLEEILAAGAGTYLEHIREMQSLELRGHEVHVKSIDRRRPTTFVIIDERVLLWQVNEINTVGEMQIYGLYVIHDTGRTLIRHFSREFHQHWDTSARPVRLRSHGRQ